MSDLWKRLTYHGEWDFTRLVRRYLVDDSEDYDRNIKKHFEIVVKKPGQLLNHPDVLALSIGGTYTKLMIASTSAGRINVKHLKIAVNPLKKTHFYDFLDKLLIEDKVVHEYLTKSKNVSLSVTLPVMIGQDSIPYHPEKIPGLDGFLARKPEDFKPEMHFGVNMKKYFALRGLDIKSFYFQADPVIAHIGGLFQTELKQDERSLLLVCGTGMATADDNCPRYISRLPMLDFDEELYPYEETEGYTYESACAGKGIFSVMKRAAKIQSECMDSALYKYNLDGFFKDSFDSKTVSQIWESTFPEVELYGKAKEIYSLVGSDAYGELQRMAAMIMDRVAGTLANSVLVTAVKLDKRQGKSKYYIIFEGSIALNKYILAAVKKQIRHMLQNDALFNKIGISKPDIVLDERPRKKVILGADIDPKMEKDVEISLIGSAVAIMADNIINGRIG